MERGGEGGGGRRKGQEVRILKVWKAGEIEKITQQLVIFWHSNQRAKGRKRTNSLDVFRIQTALSFSVNRCVNFFCK